MQQYKIFIANERYRFMKPLQVFILLINAISLTLVAFYANDPLGYIWPPLIVLSIFFVLYDQKLKRFVFFKKTNFLDTGFLWVIAAWILAGYLWIALAIVIIAILRSAVKEKFELLFSANQIELHTYPKKIFYWNNLQNIVLKDGLITIDFKNNRMIQSEILSKESNIYNEAEFNEFCRSKLNAVR
ncbi:MAG TPA: hypothetical protein PLP23_13570 [Panacibacter sp.]|nr:hypothetical protein [Panacibacter sp.]